MSQAEGGGGSLIKIELNVLNIKAESTAGVELDHCLGLGMNLEVRARGRIQLNLTSKLSPSGLMI